MAQSEISLRQNSSGSKNFVTVAYFCDKATEKHRVFTALSLFFKLPAEYAVPFPCVLFRVVGLVKDTLTLSDLLYFSICFVNRRFFTFFLANLFAVAILSDTLCFVRAGYLPRYSRILYAENLFADSAGKKAFLRLLRKKIPSPSAGVDNYLTSGYNLTMNKKVTIKDIAREAGLSIATVSYVLNNRDDKRISEATKKKVLQVVNMFNYTCNFSARHIATGKTNIVALYVNNNDFVLSLADKYMFVSRLLQELTKHGYSLRIVSGSCLDKLDNVDAILCYDTTEELFRAVGNNNFVPLLSCNNVIGDSLFYQVNTDYDKAKSCADNYFHQEYAVASLVVGNFARQQELLKVFPETQFVDSFDSAIELAMQHTDTPLLVFENSLYEFLSPKCQKIFLYDPCEEKIATLVEKMKQVIDRSDVVNYDLKF